MVEDAQLDLERDGGMREVAHTTRSVILCDIDHTVSAAHWRDEMIGGPWDDYHAASIHDASCDDVVGLLWALKKASYHLIGITARPEKWRKLTMEWLLREGVPLDEVLMRPDDAYHPAPEIKVKLAQERFKGALDQIAFIIDDRDDVVAAFKALGVSALQAQVRKS